MNSSTISLVIVYGGTNADKSAKDDELVIFFDRVLKYFSVVHLTFRNTNSTTEYFKAANMSYVRRTYIFMKRCFTSSLPSTKISFTM